MSKPKYQNIPIHQLQKIINSKQSFFEVLSEIGYTNIYQISTINNLKQYCEANNINYSHLNETRDLQQLTCKVCGETKSIAEFYRYRNKVHHVCSSCKTVQQREYARKNIQSINEYKKTKKCEKCGENRYYVLDFHHVNEEEKQYQISKRANTKFETLMEEIDKCVLLCANCHREFHYLKEHKQISFKEYLENKAQ